MQAHAIYCFLNMIGNDQDQTALHIFLKASTEHISFCNQGLNLNCICVHVLVFFWADEEEPQTPHSIS
jgi:hypothetical protein